MQRTRFTLIHQEKLAPKTYRMVLRGDTSAITAPGQFVNIALEGKFLRRPISVCDWKEGELTILYKVVGEGTEQMSRMVPGVVLDILTGLGNGYDLAHRRWCWYPAHVCFGEGTAGTGEAPSSDPGVQPGIGAIFLKRIQRPWRRCYGDDGRRFSWRQGVCH